MINRQVRQFYIDKENVDHSITDRLISGGYVQPAGGYILNAKRSGVKEPSQYWHLIYSWSAQSEDEAPFNKSIQCGELIFWMAESSGAVSKEKLNELYIAVYNWLDIELEFDITKLSCRMFG